MTLCPVTNLKPEWAETKPSSGSAAVFVALFAVLLSASGLTRIRAADTPAYDVVVYGGTSGGVIAAVQAARMGARVVLIEPGRHLGGMTSGGLGATDMGNKDTIGGMAREFYGRVKEHYARPEAWTFEKESEYHRPARHDPAGDGVMWYFEPHVAENIYRAMVREAGVAVVLGARLNLKDGVRKNGPRITRIVMESGREFCGRVYIDATYEGDLMAKAGVAYHVGREDNRVYGETVNGVQVQPDLFDLGNFFRPTDPYRVPGDRTSGLLFGVEAGPPEPDGTGDHRVQVYCYRLCLTDVPANRVPFQKPAGYDPARYELVLRWLESEAKERLFPAYPKPTHAIENPALGRNPFAVIMPNRKTDSNNKGPISFNLVGGNYDYPDGDYQTRERIIQEHIRWQQGLLYFMAHDPRVPERLRQETQCWGYAKDEFVDTNHWPHQLYVREARRMIGGYVMTQHDVTGARSASDSVGIGSYGMDSHKTRRFVTTGGWVWNEGSLGGGRVGARVKPYPISYRALTPRQEQCDNLLVPVCVSASHVAYGSIRMEPVYMILGQSAGTAAAMAVTQDIAVQRVDDARLRERLRQDGQRLEWPVEELPPAKKAPAAPAAVGRSLPSEIRPAPPAKPAPNPALIPIDDVPGLPRVLIIGDSISIGYTLLVREALKGRANVHRPPDNCSSTGYGLSKIDEWLGQGKWDVIHFNFGLHDAKLPPEGVRHAPPDVYEKNLRQLVQRMKATGAKLIWATTTPVPRDGNLAPNRRFGSIAAYNAIAAKVMEENGVATNDLNAAVAPHVARVGRPNDVHFTAEGYALLAQHVARSVSEQLAGR